jgi:hypothetical protein
MDRHLVSLLTAGPPASSAAIGDLFAAMSGGAPSAPALIGSLDTLLGLAPGTMRDLEAMNVAIVPTSAAAGTLIAVDGAGLLIADGGIELATAQHASITMDDGQAPPSTTLVNLWQQNLTAVRAERFLRIAVRSNASAWATATVRA